MNETVLKGLTIKDMRNELGDLAKPDWSDKQVAQLYRLLMGGEVLPFAVNLAAMGLLLGKIDNSSSKPIDRNFI